MTDRFSKEKFDLDLMVHTWTLACEDAASGALRREGFVALKDVEISDLNVKIERLHVVRQGLKDDITSLDKEVAALKAEVKELSKEVKELRLSNTVKDRDLLEANKTIKTRDERIRELQVVEDELKQAQLVIDEL